MKEIQALGLVLTTLVAACSTSRDDSIGESTQDMSSSWFATHLPPGSADERAVLALVNDKSMSTQEYVEECLFSRAQASAIVDYRQGDEPADAADDEVFDDVQELDRLPYTNATFWVAALACAKAHYGPAGGICGTGTSALQQSPLALELVVDGSLSMSGPKWTAQVEALNEIFTAQAAKNDPRTGFGLISFSDTKDPNVSRWPAPPVYPGALDVGVAPVDAAALAALQGRLSGARPQGGIGTPLYEAVTGAYRYLETTPLSPSLDEATKAVVVFTDGMPLERHAELVTFVAANAERAQLFAVGIGVPAASGHEYDAAYVGSLAVAGGTRSSATCDPTEKLDEAKMCHIQVTPAAKPAAQIRDELLGAFAKIRKSIAACDIGIQVLGTGGLDTGKVTVVIEDATGSKTPVPASATNGWTLDDPTSPTKVLVRGSFCDDLRADVTKRAKVEVGCK